MEMSLSPRQHADARIECVEWRAIDAAALAEQCAGAVAARFARARGGVAVLFTDAEEMRSLNKVYRDKDRPTNVLSFPADDYTLHTQGFLGDIALGYEPCRDEAQALAISLESHAAHLLIHGMLHLIGYDHQADDEAAEMERSEVDILAGLGIADPYRDPAEKE
ncbi:MAG: rRNA maturation RNase YbeY [Pseudomonadota bacterium]